MAKPIDPHDMEGVTRWMQKPGGTKPFRTAHLGCSAAGAGFLVVCGFTHEIWPRDTPKAPITALKCRNCLRVDASQKIEEVCGTCGHYALTDFTSCATTADSRCRFAKSRWTPIGG